MDPVFQAACSPAYRGRGTTRPARPATGRTAPPRGTGTAFAAADPEPLVEVAAGTTTLRKILGSHGPKRPLVHESRRPPPLRQPAGCGGSLEFRPAAALPRHPRGTWAHARPKKDQERPFEPGHLRLVQASEGRANPDAVGRRARMKLVP